MATFRLTLVSPEELVFSGEVEQVDLPGAEGDFGVLSGHMPVVAVLRPGIVVVKAGGHETKFVVLGGLAEFSQPELTILADVAKSSEDFDLPALQAQIEEMEKNLPQKSLGDELDRELARLDHYRSIQVHLNPTTAL